MTEPWTELTDWWLEEADEPAYAEEVLPLFLSIFEAPANGTVLDLGCGDGRVADLVAAAGCTVVGVDANLELAQRAGQRHAVVVHRLPGLECFATDSVDGAYVVLALEHVEDARLFFAEVARVVAPGGKLALVINHPVYTAPGSGPVLDQTDGEIYWRFGGYLSPGSTMEPAGGERVEFIHRPVGMLLNDAAAAGWILEEVEEQGVGKRAAARDPILAKHHDIPHLMAIRWARLARS